MSVGRFAVRCRGTACRCKVRGDVLLRSQVVGGQDGVQSTGTGCGGWVVGLIFPDLAGVTEERGLSAGSGFADAV
jgi:hypothetical protein